MRIYIAGPMTGLPDCNRRAFHEAADWLAFLGHTPLNPAQIDLGEGASWQDYMRKTVKLVADADAVALLPGWDLSRGATIEAQLADGLQFDVRPLDQWAEARV